MFSFIKSFMDLQIKIFMNLNKSNDEKKIGLKKKKKTEFGTNLRFKT